MLTPQSFAAAFAAIARMLSTACRAAVLRFRPSDRATPRQDTPLQRPPEPPRCAPSQPAATPAQSTRRRTPAPGSPAPGSPASARAHALRGEYRVIRVSEIMPAATPSRLVYEDIDRLVASIAGSAEHGGLGLLVPVVVRALDDDRYELIDGQRRLVACSLIAARAGAEDCCIPALVFRVSAHDALLMRLASLDSADPKPIELARTYQALRNAMAEERARAYSARNLTAFGPHEKTQISDFIRIADAISDTVLIAADLVDGDGHPSPEALVDLPNRQLLDVAKCDTVETRAAALRAHHDRLSRGGRASSIASAEVAGSHSEKREGGARRKGRSLSLVARSRTMTASEARALIEREMAPAMLALVEQAHGRRDAEGYYSAFTTGHACLVLPREVEALTLEQLDRLDQALAMLTARTRRAREERRQVDAMFASPSERLTS